MAINNDRPMNPSRAGPRHKPLHSVKGWFVGPRASADPDRSKNNFIVGACDPNGWAVAKKNTPRLWWADFCGGRGWRLGIWRGCSAKGGILTILTGCFGGFLVVNCPIGVAGDEWQIRARRSVFLIGQRVCMVGSVLVNRYGGIPGGDLWSNN